MTSHCRIGDWLQIYSFMMFWGLPLLVWLCIFFVIPLAFLVLISFWMVENFQLSTTYTLQNWKAFFSTPYFLVGYLRTFAYALAAAVLITALAFPFAYTLAFKVSAGTRRFATALLITPFFTSYLVRSYSWQIILANDGLVNAGLSQLGIGPVVMLNTPIATFIGYLTFAFPLITLLLLVSLTSIDFTLIEAGWNLGAGRLRSIVRVIVPSCRIGLIMSTAIAFIICFGDFVAPSVLGGGNPPTLSILINDTVKSASNWPGASVIALIMIITLMVVVLVAFGFAFRSRKESK